MIEDILGPELSGLTRARKRRQEQAAKPPADESLIRQIGEKGLGGLAMVGNVLDLPGSMVRDTLAGQNPFDQLLPWNWTTDTGRTSGRDLLRQYDMVGPDDTWGNFGGGLAAEVALDPLTYLTFGGSALSKSGQVAKKAGLLRKAPIAAAKKLGVDAGEVGVRQGRLTSTLDDLFPMGTREQRDVVSDTLSAMDPAEAAAMKQAPLGGMVGVGLPFMDPAFTLGTGAKSQSVAKAMDAAGRAVQFAKIPGTDWAPVNSMYQLFDNPARETTTPLGQTMARDMHGNQDVQRGLVRKQIADDALKLQELGYGSDDKADEVRDFFEDPTKLATAPVEVQQLIGGIKSRLKLMRDQAELSGMKLSEFEDDFVEYFPRYMSSAYSSPSGKNLAFSSFDSSQQGRQGMLRNIEGGTRTIRQLMQDPTFNNLIESGATKRQVADYIKTNYPGISERYIDNDEWARVQAAAKAGSPIAKPKTRNRHLALAGWAGSLDPELRKMGVFSNNPISDLLARETQFSDAFESIKSAADTLAQPGVLSPTSGSLKETGRKKLLGVIQSLDLNPGDETKGFLSEIANAMSKNGQTVTVADLRKMTVDEKTAGDLTRFMKGYTTPESVGPIMEAFDWFTNLTKGTLTAPFPAFHVRNFVSGQFQNLIDGSFSLRSLKDAWNFMRGGEVVGAKDIPAVRREWARRNRGSAPMAMDDAYKNSEIAFRDPNTYIPEPADATTGRLRSPFAKQLQSSTIATPSPDAGDIWQRPNFRSLSKYHASFDDSIEKLVADGALKSTDADILRLAFSGASEDGMRIMDRPVMRAVDSIDAGGGQSAAGRWNWGVNSKTGLLEFSIEIAKDRPASQSGLSVLLHELGHMAQFSYKQLPGNDWGGELSSLINRAMKNDRLRQEFSGLHGEKIGNYLTYTFEEQFPQLFADSIIRRKVPQGALGKIITDVRDWIVQFLEKLKLVKSIPKPTQKRIDEIIDQLLGFDGKSFESAKASDSAVNSPKTAYMASSGKELTDAEATKILGELSYAYGMAPRLGGEVNSVVGRAAQMDPGGIEELLGDIPRPGNKMFSAKEAGKMYVGQTPDTSLNPFAQRGVGGNYESAFGPVASGQYVGGAVETFNRTAPFMELLRQGMSPDAAAKKVAEAQVDYGSRNYTKFEKEVMTRVLPFYKFSKGMLPYTLRNLVERPGGRMGQTMQAIGQSSDPDGLTPDYIAETTSIPLEGTFLGQNTPEGTDRYLTGFGLMFEDPMSFLGGGLRGAMLEGASRTNPLIKAPMEWMTGESFFQRGPMGGRDLQELDPSIGRILANVTGQEEAVEYPGQDAIEFIVGNSPLSRVVSSVRQATDPRKDNLVKAVNLLTGARVADVSPGVKDQLLRDLVQDQMVDQGAEQFLRTYFSKDDLAKMTPQQRTEAGQLQAIMNMLAARAKERKKEKEARTLQEQALQSP